MLKHGDSILIGAKIVAKPPTERACTALPKTMTKTKFHEITGHTGIRYLNSTADYMGIKLTGTVNKCVHCALEKIRQANIPKENINKSDKPGESMYLDITSMKHSSFGGKKHWAFMVDEATNFKQGFFLRKKKEQVNPIFTWLKTWKAKFTLQ